MFHSLCNIVLNAAFSLDVGAVVARPRGHHSVWWSDPFQMSEFDSHSAVMLTANAPGRRKNADDAAKTALEEDKKRRRKSMADERKRRRWTRQSAAKRAQAHREVANP